ncbi:MAG: FUSC family protein [Cyanobacteriota bacterium]|jgi:uncharacterized membrane protein YccC
MNADLLRNSLKLGVATVITTALAVRFDRLAYAWYPLLAVVIVVDDNDDHTLVAASGRILGTVTGCLLTFLVHSILDGWPGVLVSLLLMVPLLRLLGWQGALGTAGLIPIVFLMIPSHAALNWTYALDRSLDTAVGCGVALAVGLLFWPRDGLRQLEATEDSLRVLLRTQLGAYGDWLAGQGPRPQPLPPAPLGEGLERMEALAHHALAAPRWRQPRIGNWRRRVALWRSLRLHWVQWERLLAAIDLPTPAPGQAPPLADAVQTLAAHLRGLPPREAPAPTLEEWSQLARESGRPLMPLLALAAEQRPLLASGRALADQGWGAPCP